MALFTPNTTVAALNGTSATNVTASGASKAAAAPVLLSASYSFTMDNGESVFVVAQTPLSQNYSSEALLMTLQSSNVKDSQFANITSKWPAQRPRWLPDPADRSSCRATR
jgi:hypothetical protein